jgi:hypothetical protein
MEYAIDMGSGAMIYIPSLRHSEADGGIQTHRQQGDLISLLSVCQNKESRLKICALSLYKFLF